VPGFSFPTFNNNGTSPLPNSVADNPAIVGFQGLNNLGVGRTSPNANVGGLVFAASSNSFSLLLRALKTQGRLDVLSSPRVMTLDNQTAAVNIGQDFPIITSTTVTATGLVTPSFDRRNVGVLLRVTPRITPENKVLMRVFPEVSSVGQTVNLGNGNIGQAFNIQQVETTVVAQDGETVLLGGLIQQSDNKVENKIPCLGDLPYVGAAFRYRTQIRKKSELLIVLTPYVIRTQADQERMLSEEARKMHWIESDIAKIYGPGGLNALLPNGIPGCAAPGSLTSAVPPAGQIPWGLLTPMPNGRDAPLPNPPVVPQIPYGTLTPTVPGAYPAVAPNALPPGGPPAAAPNGAIQQQQYPPQAPAAAPGGPALTPAAYNYPPQAQPQQAPAQVVYYPPPQAQQQQAPTPAPAGGMAPAPMPHYPPQAPPQGMPPMGGTAPPPLAYYPPQGQPQGVAPAGGMAPAPMPNYPPQGQPQAMAPQGGPAPASMTYYPPQGQPQAMAPAGGMAPAPAGYQYPPTQQPPQAQAQNPQTQGKDSQKWSLFNR
jgi:hypothetical protein